MSQLEQLLAELCPSGVEYRPLRDVCYRQKGTSITAGEMKILNKPGAPIRIFAGGNTIADVNYGDIPNGDVINNTSIIVKSRGNIGFEYYDLPFSHKNEMWSYSTTNEDVDLKFIYYYLQTHAIVFQQKAKAGKLPQISTPDTDNFTIPIPPLRIQEEIVRILDTFTTLDAGLEVELEARTKQYETYRDSLLDFTSLTPLTPAAGLKQPGEGEKALYPHQPTRPTRPTRLNQLIQTLCPDGVEYHTLEELTTISRGVRVVRGQLTDDGEFPVYQNSMTPLGYFGKSNCRANSAFVITAGAAGEVGFSTIDFWAADDCFYFVNHDQLNSKFLYYSILRQQDYLLSRVRRASVPRLSRTVIEKLSIPVPPIPVQEEIVAILDRFDALVNDLKNGLPAEITARRKQYEYYRNQLLTFEPKTMPTHSPPPHPHPL